MTRINMPVPFDGTPEEEAANRASHNYQGLLDDGDVRCVWCDCRPSYVSAGWPCGASVPRMVVER